MGSQNSGSSGSASGASRHHPRPRCSANDHARHYFCAIPEGADRDAIAQSIRHVVAEVQTYVPGYRLLNEPQFDDPSINSGGQAMVTTFVEVEGAGDYLPPYAGNLDIMTAAATKVGRKSKESLAAADERTGRPPLREGARTMAIDLDLTTYKALSFDCYGTLIDWEAGIAAVLRAGPENRAPT